MAAPVPRKKASFELSTLPAPAMLPPEPPTRAVTWRSAVLGTLLAGVVCALVPYNDYIVENTVFVGSYLPLAMVLTFFVLVVLVNAPLHRWAPRLALTRGELAVVMAMMLAACGIAAQGMLRSLIPTMVSSFYLGQQDPRFWNNFLGLDLPQWLFPVGAVVDGRNSPVLAWFYNRVPEGTAIPYSAWIVPLAGWGVFMFSLLATLFALARIVGPQWAVNERLSFPIAQMQNALIEPPEPGRSLNPLFRSRGFWIALGSVFFIQMLWGLDKYFPKFVPEIPLRYDLRTVFSETPWVYFGDTVKAATIYCTFIGITYFIPSRMGFSLWSIYLITECIAVQRRSVQDEIPDAAWMDQHLGASVAFLVGVLWIGRAHWWAVMKQAFLFGRKSNGPNYRPAVFTVIGGIVLMTIWLLAVGVHLWVAALIVAVLMLVHLVIARVVAETGLPFIRSYVNTMQVVTAVPPTLMSGHDVYFSGVFMQNGTWPSRESFLVFALHGLKVNGQLDDQTKPSRGLVALIAWALVFGFIVSSVAWLNMYYTHSMPLTARSAVENHLALVDWPKGQIVDPLNQWADGRFPAKAHNPGLQMGIGATVTGLLQFATLRWSGWPFMPVGYVLSYSPYIRNAWFSIFLGWLAKTVIVRFGGARMYQNARPLFVGLVFGEGLAAGCWMVINLLLAWLGYDYKFIQLLPQ